MSLLAGLARAFRRPRGNRRVARYARRTASTLSTGPTVREAERPVRALLWGLLALVGAQAEAGLLSALAPGAAFRVEIPALLIVFAALELTAIEGAITAFLCGYVADLFLDTPAGTGRALAVGLFVSVRVAATRMVLPPAFASALFTALGVTGWHAGVWLGGALSTTDVATLGRTVFVALPSALLTAALAPWLHGWLARLDAKTSGASAAGA